jgi:glycosyltransferase involved in cell wall biosynthesis
MKQKKNNTLVVLTPAFPANESETHWVPFIHLMMRTLREQGQDMVIISLNYPLAACTYDWHGIRVISLGGMHKRRLARASLWRKAWHNLQLLRHQTGIGGLLSIWCGETAAIGNWFGRRYKIPHCTWLCGQDARPGNKWVSLIRPRANELAAISPFLVDEFEKNYKVRPQFFVPIAVDTTRFPQPALAKDIDIIGAGSLVQLKRYDRFVSVIARLKNELRDIRCVHCGTGPEFETIQAMIQQHNLVHNLQLIGEVPNEEVTRLMCRSRILLHTSEYEGFGLVCLEALCAGAHVISFHYPLDRQVPHWHVARNEEEMAEIAESILKDPGTNYDPVSVYSLEESARQLSGIFNLSTEIYQDENCAGLAHL